MSSGNFAKSVLASSLLSVVLLSALVYVTRDQLATFLLSNTTNSNISSPTQLEKDSSQENKKTIPDIVKKANQSVVSIVITKNVPVYEQYYEEYDPFGGMFGEGFLIPRWRREGFEEQEVGGGSGFIVSPQGLLVTNQHVVGDENAQYSVVLSNGEIYEVSVLERDDFLDIAILQIENTSDKLFPYLDFGDSSNLQLGQTVIAIGNALAEFDNSVSVGVVSGLSRSITARDTLGRSEQLEQVIQTDAAINPGNSGGPLLDLSGDVIGVSVAASLQAQNIGFALPANVVKQIVSSVQKYGEIVRP